MWAFLYEMTDEAQHDQHVWEWHFWCAIRYKAL